MSRQIVIFSDFDGTIALKDTGTIIIDACMGYDRRKALDMDILHGRRSFRDAVHEMWAAVDFSWEEAVELVKDVQLDTGFDQFYDFCVQNKIPITVLSSGLQQLVEMFLKKYDKLEILANEIILGDHWQIQYRDETHYGHDKGYHLREIKASGSPLVIFVGDGVSDIPAAREADHVFARKGKDLEQWCQTHNVAYTSFESFHDIHRFIANL
ncbi:HAD-like domain-containing protein [Gorgonomyces haynaldii]|nr:HAD-like domain-containing protein [Gorgonomyces haynaldii]